MPDRVLFRRLQLRFFLCEFLRLRFNIGLKRRGRGGAGEAVSGGKAKRWAQGNNLTDAQLEQVFHFDDGNAQLLDITVPGTNKRAQAVNCYLLVGAERLLEDDEPRFIDASAVAFCTRAGCYDRSNHAKTRAALGNVVTGNKNTGYALSAPGLKAAAELIKQISPVS